MKIVLFGNDPFAARALEAIIASGNSVMTVVADAAGGKPASSRLLHASQQKNIPVLLAENPNSAEVERMVKSDPPDFIICVHLRKILQPRIYRLALRGALNVHPSILPKYRGLSPFEQAILHGDAETGVTIHLLGDAVDAGGIVLQRRLTMAPDIDLFQLQRMMLPLYSEMIPLALTIVSSGSFQPLKQDETAASWFGPVKEADRRISPHLDIVEIDRRIRAYSKPGKGALYENRVIWRAAMIRPDQVLNGKTIPVDKTEDENDLFVIQAKDGFLISRDFEIIATKNGAE